MHFWNPKRLARLTKAVRSYNAAITNAAKRNGSYDGLPRKYTVQEVKDIVGEDAATYRRFVGNERDRYRTTLTGKPKKPRPSYLDRVLKSVSPNALEINPKTGNSNFVDRENRYSFRRDKRRANETRNSLLRKLRETEHNPTNLDRREDYYSQANADQSIAFNILEGYDLDGMSPAKEATAMVDAPIKEPRRKDYLDVWDLEEHIFGEAQSRMHNQVKNWIDVWTAPTNLHNMYSGYDEVISMIEEMEDEYPDVLIKLFGSGYDEIVPDFIYITPKSPAFANISFEQRHRRAVRVITAVYNYREFS